MKTSTLVIGLLAVFALFIAALAFFRPPMVERISDGVGGASGTEHTNSEFFDGGLTFGSNCLSTSTTGTLSASVLDNNSCIYIAPTGAGQGALSITLPATTTMDALIPKKGSCQSWFVDASDVAAGTTTTFVAGAGHDMVGLDATGAGTGADVIDGLEFGRLTMCRENNGDVATFVQEYIHAD